MKYLYHVTNGIGTFLKVPTSDLNATCTFHCKVSPFFFSQMVYQERSGSVVECLTRGGRVAGSSLTGGTALCP